MINVIINILVYRKYIHPLDRHRKQIVNTSKNFKYPN